MAPKISTGKSGDMEVTLVELQGTGEGRSFSRAEATGLMDLGLAGCAALMKAQDRTLA